MSKCKGCGAEIKWVRMVSGKRMPVDLPGLKVVTRDGYTDEYEVRTGYTSHFATCPHATLFRKEEK